MGPNHQNITFFLHLVAMGGLVAAPQHVGQHSRAHGEASQLRHEMRFELPSSKFSAHLHMHTNGEAHLRMHAGCVPPACPSLKKK